MYLSHIEKKTSFTNSHLYILKLYMAFIWNMITCCSYRISQIFYTINFSSVSDLSSLSLSAVWLNKALYTKVYSICVFKQRLMFYVCIALLWKYRHSTFNWKCLFDNRHVNICGTFLSWWFTAKQVWVKYLRTISIPICWVYNTLW